MSYTRRCAEAPIGNILKKARKHPDWQAMVLDTNELCLRYKCESGHYIFPWINVQVEPERITTSVACFASPSRESDAALLKLIRSAKPVR